MKIGYIVDSGFAIPKTSLNNSFIQRIEFVEFIVIDPLLNEYVEKKVTITENTVLQLFRKFPRKGLKTSLTPENKLKTKIREMLRKYDYVIGIPIAKSLSGQYDLFKKISLSNEFKGKFFVYGKRNTGSTAFNEIFILDQYLSNEKVFNETIYKKILSILKERIITKAFIFTSDLYRISLSGRISKIKAILGSIGNQTIVLSLNDYKVDLVKRGRSVFKLVNLVIKETIKDMKKVIKNSKISADLYFFDVKNEIRNRVINLSSELIHIKEISNLPAIYAVHLGRGIIGILITCEKNPV